MEAGRDRNLNEFFFDFLDVGFNGGNLSGG